MTLYRTYDDWKLASPDDEPDYNADPIGECDCCGKQRPLALIRTPLGHKTWECKECTVEWDGDSDGFNEQAGGY